MRCAWLTRFPCARRDLAHGCPQVSIIPGKLSTGCVEDLWISEVIILKVADRADNSDGKPYISALSV